MQKILFILLAISMITIPSQAQRRKKVVKKVPPKVVVEEETPAEKLFKSMLPATAKMMFIDSIVVDKDRFLEAIPLPSNCGKLMTTANFLKAEKTGTTFINEFGNKAYYSYVNNEGDSRLMTKDRLQNQWSEECVVEGIEQHLSPNYPFMMPDGTTLYFAQKGEEALGGYDIFVTRYNPEEGRFFNPENIGLPFNSKANDYMYVEDELDELGWFVTDRNQPEGKVCVYTFVPSRKRVNYDTDEMDDQEIKTIASIRSIQDTWINQDELQAAQSRLQRLRERNQNAIEGNSQDAFVVNDDITYTSAKQFRSNTARKMYEELLKIKKQQKQAQLQLDDLRVQYHQADTSKRHQMHKTVLAAEENVAQLNFQIKQLEKSVRNAEISSIR